MTILTEKTDDNGSLAQGLVPDMNTAVVAGQWQLIETADFSDDIVLLWREGDDRSYAGWYLGGESQYEWAFVDETRGADFTSFHANAYFKGYGPTHWMPLPAGPAEAIANATLIAAAPALLEACLSAAKTFRRYEAMHEAKGTVEGCQKAGANASYAKALEAAIAEAQQVTHD